MVINIDSKDFCDLMNFVANCTCIYDIKFEVDQVMNDCISITISECEGGNIYHSRKLLFLRDLICGTFGITEAIKRTIIDMERDIMNYIEKENKLKVSMDDRMIFEAEE